MNHPEEARRIQLALHNAGITQQELADRSGIGKASISHYVHGRNIPTNKAAYKVSLVLNVNPVWLMGFEVPMEPAAFYPDDFTLHERDIIRAYRRSSEEIKTAVCAVLGVKRDQNSDKEELSSG